MTGAGGAAYAADLKYEKNKKTTLETTSIILAGGALALSTSHARVTRIVIDAIVPMAAPVGSLPPAIAYEEVAGRAFGELDAKLPGNALIQDIELARDADGKIRYVASFVI